MWDKMVVLLPDHTLSSQITLILNAANVFQLNTVSVREHSVVKFPN